MLLLRLLLLLSAACSAAAYETLELPSVDYRALHDDGALLAKLQRYGTLAIQSVPGYSALRQEYLTAATACVRALESTADGQQGLLYRVMDDGTERYTLLSLRGENDPLPAAKCPAFQAVKLKFSALVERTVVNLGAALDKNHTQGSEPAQTPDAASLSAVVASGRHMDHFHAYLPRTTVEQVHYPTTGSSDAPWTLGMHSDLGVFIAMAPPAFFEVFEGEEGEELRPVDNPDPDSGLVIKTPTGEIVRPQQHPDDLIVMVGDGFSAWTSVSLAIPAVVHGMVMPATCHSKPIVRAWFGKMVLPAPEVTLRSTNETFGVFTDKVNEYFSDLDTHAERSLTEPEGFASVACPSMASDTSAKSMRRLLDATTCAYRVCEPILNPDYKESCSFWCNLARTTTNADNCAKHCRCSQNLLTENVFLCWSGCFEYTNDCDQQLQTCIGDSNDATGYATVKCGATPLTDEQREERAGMGGVDFSTFPGDQDDMEDGGETDSGPGESISVSDSASTSDSDSSMSGMSESDSEATDSAGAVHDHDSSSSSSAAHEHESMASMMSGMRD